MNYSQRVLAHFHEPRRVGSYPLDAHNVLTARAGSRQQGELLQLQIRLTADHKIIENACFKAHGSVATIAVGSFLADWLVGKKVEELSQCTAEYIMKELSLPAIKRHAALLAETVLQQWRAM